MGGCHIRRHRMLTSRENTVTEFGNVRVSGFNGLGGGHGNLQQREAEAGCIPLTLCLYGGRCCETPKVVCQSAPDNCETELTAKEDATEG